MKKINRPKFIIFDCFETIVNNDLSAWKNLFGSFIDENKWEIETEKLWELWKSKEINFREIRTNLKDLNSNPPFKSYEKAWSDCFKKVFEELKFNANPDELARRCIINMGKNKPYEDTSEYLNKLSRHSKIGIISNADNDFLNPVLKNIDFKFDYVLSSETAKLYKPDRRIFSIFLKENNLRGEDCWYIGDKEYDDVLGSSSVGMKPFLINRSVYNEIMEKDEYVSISNLIQLNKLIKK